MALAMQQLLLAGFNGILDLPADQVGVILCRSPRHCSYAHGGASADQTDARQLLVRIYFIAPILPLFLLLMEQWQWLGVHKYPMGLGMSVVQSYSMPGQQAILNRVSGSSVQQGVTVATAIGYLVQVIGLGLAGQIDRLGVFQC